MQKNVNQPTETDSITKNSRVLLYVFLSHGYVSASETFSHFFPQKRNISNRIARVVSCCYPSPNSLNPRGEVHSLTAVGNTLKNKTS